MNVSSFTLILLTLIVIVIRIIHLIFKQLTFSDLKYIIETSLFKRLESVNIHDYQGIISNLSQELTKNQSVLTMVV